MAGIMGIPIGTFGPRGADFSPYMQMQQMRQREQERLRQEALARAELGQQQETSFLNREAQRLMQERQEALTRDQMTQGQARWQSETDYNRQRNTERDLLDREQTEFARRQAEAERQRVQGNADREFGLREREFESRQSLLGEARQREQAKEAEAQGRSQVRGRARAIIAERVNQIQDALAETDGIITSLGARPTGGMKPERLRDLMLAETQEADLTPADREEVQAAIEEWYQEALKAEDAGTAREFNREKLAQSREQSEGQRVQRQAAQEGRDRAAQEETERKRAADMDRARNQRLTLIDRRLGRLEKRREEVYATMEYQRGKDGTEEQVVRLERELRDLDAKIAKLEAEEEEAVTGGGERPRAAVNSTWGDTLSE